MDFDLNQTLFQEGILELGKAELVAFFKTLRKLKQLSWQEVYTDKGLKWEAVKSAGESVYTIRITQKCRATVKRDGDVLRFISLHPDHDSAYE